MHQGHADPGRESLRKPLIRTLETHVHFYATDKKGLLAAIHASLLAVSSNNVIVDVRTYSAQLVNNKKFISHQFLAIVARLSYKL